MDPFLIVTICVLSVVMLVVMILLFVCYGHPDDRTEAWFPKIVTVFGLWIAFCSVLVLPYDVANSRGSGGGIRVDILWYILYISLACLVAVLIPFAYFYYESEIDEADVKGFCDTQCGQGLCYTTIFLVVFVTILGILYAFLAQAEIPVTRYMLSPARLTEMSDVTYTGFVQCEARFGCIKTSYLWAISVTFPVFIMAILAFLGWFLWTIFVGCGLFTLPMDLLNDYKNRPVPMTDEEYRNEKKKIGDRSKLLLEAAKALKTAEQNGRHGQSGFMQRSRDRTARTRLEQAYLILKRDVELFEAAKQLRGVDGKMINFEEDNIPLNLNPLWYIFKLVMGIIGTILTLTWLIHIFIFVLPRRPLHPFLNDFFIQLESVGGGSFPLFGVLAYAIYGCYLLTCVVVGSFRCGTALPFFRLFPMEVGKTRMNAFLANTWIILVCAVPTVQFSVLAFPLYARETQIDMLFGTQVQYIRYLKYFWENNVFVIAMICISFLALILAIVRPMNKSQQIEDELRAIAGRPLGQP